MGKRGEAEVQEVVEEEPRHSSDEALEVDLPVDAGVQSEDEEEDQEEHEDIVAEEGSTAATSGVGNKKIGFSSAIKRARLDSGDSNCSGALSGDRSSCSAASSGSSGDETFKEYTLSRGN